MRENGILLQQKARVTENSRYMFVKITKTERFGNCKLCKKPKMNKNEKKCLQTRICVVVFSQEVRKIPELHRPKSVEFITVLPAREQLAE